MTNIIDEINAEQMNNEFPEFAPGDTIIVNVKVKEGNRERVQAFEGVCIAIRNRGLNSCLYRSQDIPWYRCRTRLSDPQSADRLHQGQASR